MGRQRPERRECEGGPVGALRKTRGWSEGGHKAEYKLDSKTRELDCGRGGGQNPSMGMKLLEQDRSEMDAHAPEQSPRHGEREAHPSGAVGSELA